MNRRNLTDDINEIINSISKYSNITFVGDGAILHQNLLQERINDAKFIDNRDNSVKSGKELSCNRTNRSVLRNNSNNLRIYRSRKISKGKFVIRRQHYSICKIIQ